MITGKKLGEIALISENTPIQKPYIIWKQRFVRIPQNMLNGTEYAVGGYKVDQHSANLSYNVQMVLRTLNTIQEELSFITLYQIPTISSNQRIGSEENKQLKEILQNHLGKQIQQLETNRKNIRKDIESIEHLAQKEYETLYEHQQSILNILNENKTEDLEQIFNKHITEITSIIEQKIDPILEKLEGLRLETKEGLEHITKLVKNLGDKL